MSEKYYVSRQSYWPDGDLVVEIASGGLDYSNADMLSDTDRRYAKLGCDWEYNDPREALKAAIATRDAWKERFPEEEIRVETGYTGGYTMPFTGFPDDEQLQEWVKKKLGELEHCNVCGEYIFGDPWYNCYDMDTHYCSQFCAETGSCIVEDEEDEDEDN